MSQIQETDGAQSKEFKKGPQKFTDKDNKFAKELFGMLEDALDKSDDKPIHDPSAISQQSTAERAKNQTAQETAQASSLMASGNQKEAQKRGLV